jgi:hypothetical protein
MKPKSISLKNKMNKTEARYSQQLEFSKRAGIIIDYKFEAIKFRLADNTFYTPDFLIVMHESFEIHEVKGFWRDDARVKIKIAAEMFPWFTWIAVSWIKKEWKFEYFN